MPKLNARILRVSIISLLCVVLVLFAAGCFTASATAAPVQAQSSNGPVIIANFNVPVDYGSSTFMSRVVSTAKSQHAAAIVIEMNTPGGEVSDMMSIVSSIQDANASGIPTYTYIVPEGLGASAGSYIAMATNVIIMGPGSEIGPSTPIVVGGTALEQNHTQAALLSYMQALAADWGRNLTAVYNMVQYDQAYSDSQAVAYHVAEGTANSLQDALSQLGLSSNPQTTLGENFYEQLLSALSNTTLDGILFIIGVIAIVIDIFHPTIILTILGVIAITVGLVGAEIVGASFLGIVLLILAAALIVLELKLGHGFALIGGVILGAIGIYFLAFNLQYSPSPVTEFSELELVLLVALGVIAGLYVRWVIKPIRSKAKLTGAEAMIGKSGVAATDLTPKGDVRVRGETWRAESLSGNIKKGERIRVKTLKGLVVLVEKASETTDKTANTVEAK